MKYRFLTRMWKVTALLTFLFSMQASLYATQAIETVKVTLSVVNMSYERLFSQLEAQSGYTFLYKKEDIQNLRSRKLDIKDQRLDLVLNELCKSAGLIYEIDDKVIIVRKTAKQSNPRTVSTVQQERILRGRVTNNAGMPLGGASVSLKNGSGRTVQTDEQGVYVLPLSSSVVNPVLVFKFVGMETKEITLSNNQSEINVQLLAAENVLEEAVIVGGYGLVQKRSDMVGSAFQVTAEQIKNLPAQRIDNMLEGLVPGLQIDFNTDQASSTRPRMNLRIRGEASLSASNEPLWIVDGIRVYTGDRTNMIPGMSTAVSPLSYLNPEDIESITVLKDATMSSIYGADGSNGVILITTKQGQISAPSLSVTSRYGLAQINSSTLFKTLDGEQYRTLAHESYLNVPGNDMASFPYQDLPGSPYSTTDTDWTDVYYGTGKYFQNNLNIRGGTENLGYYISGEYFLNESTVKGNRQDRFSLRSNIDFKLTEKLKLKLLMSGSYNVDNIFNPSTDYYSLLPIISPYNADGSPRQWYDQIDRIKDPITGEFIIGSRQYRFLNSVAERDENDNMQRGFYTVNNLVLDYSILPTLKLTSQIGANLQSNHEELYSARTNWSGKTIEGEPRGYAYRNHANFLLWSAIERLNYSQQFGKHTVGGLLGFEASSQDNRSLNAQGNGFANDHIKEVSYAAVRENSGSSASRTRRSSFFGQGSYNYNSKYFFALNMRADGNSDFGEDTRWGTFWSVGSSWNIHNEDFFNSDLLKVLKLKASFGTNGNSRLGNMRAQGLYTYGTSSNYYGMSGSTMSNVWNRRLSWEQSYMTNIGIRANFNNRVDVDLEFYNKHTVDLLQEQDVSRATGDTRVTRNIGSTLNRGIELTIESTNIDLPNFSWITSANVSHNQNKLLKLHNGISQVRNQTIWTEGEDLSTYYLVRWAGVDPRDGAPMWYDVHGNITHTFNLADRVPYKTSTPWFFGGITNTLQYKDLTFSFLAIYSAGGYRFTSFGRDASSDGLHLMTSNQSINQLDRWQQPGDLTLSPKPLWQLTNANSTRNSTRYLSKATYLRLKNISMSYNLSQQWANRIGTKGISLTLIADNLGVWTPYDRTNWNSFKQTMSGYPMETTVSVGVNVKL